MKKLYKKLILVTVFAAVIGLGFILLEESETKISINGVVCNHSSAAIWLVTSQGERTATSSLDPGQCTDFFQQDAEAIWGRDCSTDPCAYQAWKLGAGRFSVYDESGSGSLLRIRGWGAGSSWHVTEEWPKPELSSLKYSLMR